MITTTATKTVYFQRRPHCGLTKKHIMKLTFSRDFQDGLCFNFLLLIHESLAIVSAELRMLCFRENRIDIMFADQVGFIDEEEFVLLYDLNTSKNPDLPYSTISVLT